MINKLEEKRINAITYLLERLKEKQVGKKSIQKLIYLLQELGVDLNYRYKMYHYGPYCSELSNDLDIMDMTNTINIEPNPNMYGYSIKLGEFGKEQASDIEQLLYSDREHFDKLLSVFGECSAKELELYATMHLVERILRKREQDWSQESVTREVKILKPKYPDNDIKKAYKYLLDESIIGQDN